MEQLNLNPLQVAQYFIDQCDASAGDSITHLKLQKLLFYVQAWGMVLANKSFFSEKFQAWAHGPVLPSVYKNLKQHGFNNIAGEIIANDVNFTPSAKDVLNQVWDTYGELSAKHLERLTHQELPWIEARGGISPEARSETEISPDTIFYFYSKLQADE